MAEKITTKNTKNEILQAYNELLAKVQEQRQTDRREETKQKEEKEIVEKASHHSIETIVKNLADRRLTIVKALDGLGEELIGEYKKLTEIQQAIEIEKQNLDTVYEIKTNADSLAALLLAQKEKTADFEGEMERERSALEEETTDKRLQWKKEQETFEQAEKEKLAQIQKEREREEEEYNYDLQLTRKKDSDTYEAEKMALEKELGEKRRAFEQELSEREAALSGKEQEYLELKTTVESFPAELEEAVEAAKAAVRQELELTYKHAAELTKREMESEQRLSQQMISALEMKIKEQEAQIRQMAQKTDEAGSHVQNIALKAIEGASTQRVVYGDYDKGNKENE